MSRICSCPGCDCLSISGRRRPGAGPIPLFCGGCELHGCSADRAGSLANSLCGSCGHRWAAHAEDGGPCVDCLGSVRPRSVADTCRCFKAAPPLDRDALVLEGFADCEALVVQMLTKMADDAREEGAFTQNPHGGIAMLTLRSAALAVSLGQHRTDRYDADEVRAVHAKAGMAPGMQSKGGKARAASMTAKQRSAAGRKAVKARWARKETE